jgi:hypothetical protein
MKALLAAFVGMLCGCTFDVPVKPSDAQPAAIPEGALVLPLTVGLYLSEEFRNRTTDAEFYGFPVNNTYVFPIGEASVGRWEEFTTELFLQVGILTSLRGDAAAAETIDRAALDRATMEAELAELQEERAKLEEKCLSAFGTWRAWPVCIDYEEYRASDVARLEAELAALSTPAPAMVETTETVESAETDIIDNNLEVTRWVNRYSLKQQEIEQHYATLRTALANKCRSGLESWRTSPKCMRYEGTLAEQADEIREALAALETERAALGETEPSAADIELILVPTIEHVSVRVPVGYGWIGNYWVEVTYGIKLYSAAGTLIADWRVIGRGTNTHGMDIGRPRLPTEAMDAAILDAGDSFMTAFAFQPQIAAWLAANLSPDVRQQTCRAGAALPVDGTMPPTSATSPTGLVAGIETIVGAERQQELIGTAIENPQILAVRLVLRNDGDRSWIVRRQDLRLKMANGRELAALDGTSLILSTDGTVSYNHVMLAGDPGTTMSSVAAGLNVLGLIVAGIAASERKDLLMTIRDREYSGSCLPPAGSTAGIVYFAIPPDTPRENLELIVSAHDLTGDGTTNIGLAVSSSDPATNQNAPQ